MPDMPEFMTPGQEGFVMIHEMFLGLCQGGFTEYQALVIIAHMFSAASNKADDEDKAEDDSGS